MALGKNRQAIKRFAGGALYALPIADEVAGPASGDTGWLDLGYVESSTLNDNTEIEEIKDETGNVINADEVERTVKFNALLMQSDKQLQDFLKETVRGNYYFVYHDGGSSHDGSNAKYIEYWLGICQIKPMIEIESGTRRIPIEITVLKNESAIEIGDTAQVGVPTVAKDYDSIAGDGTVETSGGYTLPANEYYLVTELTVA